jgi:type IV pilus assembly protein PilW
MAGYMGCASIDKIPVTVKASNPPSDVVFDSSNIVRGLDNVTTGNAYNAQPGTDVLIIRRASDSGVRLDGNMTADNANISIVANNAGFVADDYLFISDCMSADLFKATNVSTGSVTIAHSSSGNIDPKLSKVYGSDAEVLAFRSVAYFIQDTGRKTQNNQPIFALYTQARGVGQGAAALASYELVEGVENLQLRFGLDTSGDGAADEYRTANNITTNAQWSSVVAVRLDLLMQSTDGNVVPSVGDAAQRLNFNGASITSDGRLRQAYSMVVAIRNRLQ